MSPNYHAIAIRVLVATLLRLLTQLIGNLGFIRSKLLESGVSVPTAN